jgi:hypothetical protein
MLIKGILGKKRSREEKEQNNEARPHERIIDIVDATKIAETPDSTVFGMDRITGLYVS